jgi:hypothetical protein
MPVTSLLYLVEDFDGCYDYAASGDSKLDETHWPAVGQIYDK